MKWVSAFLFLFSTYASGQTHEAGRHWLKIFDSLEASGIYSIGTFRLDQFRTEASGIEWKNISTAPASVLSGSRTSAFYLSGKKKIWVASQIPAEALSYLPQLELHEVFGALGYNDQNGSLSMTLDLMSKVQSAEQKKRLKKVFEILLEKNKVILMAGGIGVSGGGDLPTLHLKNLVWHHILDQNAALEWVSDDFLITYPSINFEPMHDPKQTQVVIKYEYKVKNQSRPAVEVFSVYVPMSKWKSTQTKQQLIEEIAKKVVEVFPARPHSIMRTFKPSACRSNSQLATYPKTNDPSVAAIQDFRANLQLGCRNADSNLTDLSVTAPAIVSGTEPLNPGYYSFSCEFRYGLAKQPYKIKIPLGVSASGSAQWSFTGEDYIGGTIFVNPEGNIKLTTLSLKSPTGSMQQIGPAQSKGPHHGLSQVLINGRYLIFECVRDH